MKQTKKIKSILKAIDVLEELSKKGEGISLTDLSRKLNFHTSTTYRLLDTLASRGYVSKNNGFYHIGPGILKLQALTKQKYELSQLARPFINDLRDKTGFTTSLAIKDGLSVVPIQIARGSAKLVVNSNLGERIPLYAPSLGKCILAYLPSGECEKIIEKLTLKILTPNTITNKEELRKELENIKKRGYGIDNEEYAEGVFCIGAPILDKQGIAVASISVAAALHQIQKENLLAYVKYVKDTSSRISNRYHKVN